MALAIFLPVTACKNNKKKRRVVSEDDPYYDAKISDIKIETDPSKKLKESVIREAQIIGNSVVAAYSITYEIPMELKNKFMSESVSSDIVEDFIRDKFSEYSQSGIGIFDFDGNLIFDITADYAASQTVFAEGKDGDLLAVFTSYDTSYELYAEATITCRMCKYTMEGLQKFDIAIPTEAGTISQVFEAESGEYILRGYEGITVLDAGGYTKDSIEVSDNAGRLLEIDGKYYLEYYEYPDNGTDLVYSLQEFDPVNVNLKGEKKQLEARASGYTGRNNGTVVMDGYGISRVDLFSDKKEQILSWDSTDVNYINMDQNSLKVLSDDSLVFLREINEKNMATGAWTCSIDVVQLTRMEKNPHAGKTRIEMGMIGYPTEDLMDYIIRYNTTAENNARIRVRDYSTEGNGTVYYDQNGEAEIAEKAYLDIQAGTGPDILVNFSRFSQFNSEEVLVDLNKYVDGGNGLNREEYFENVLSAFETKDKLYQIPACFEIRGLIGNKEIVGERSGWTYAEFNQIVRSLPYRISVIENMAYDDFLDALLSCATSEFIDYSRKEVYFDGDEFKQLLKIVKSYGVPNATFDGNLINSEDDVEFVDDGDRFNDGMLALMTTYMCSVDSYASNRGAFGDKAIYIGMPSPDGTGMCALPTLTLAISAKSDSKDEAWDFIRRLFDEDSQYSYTKTLDSIPLNRNAFDRINQEVLEKYQKWVEEYKEELKEYGLSTDDVFSITEEDLEGFAKLVENVSTIMSFDAAVSEIIKEEAAAYFQNEKPIDDVCASIQDRTTRIVHER
jgi:ABC-type glycerol-3-phosphate transport system substrate-binding protein